MPYVWRSHLVDGCCCFCCCCCCYLWKRVVGYHLPLLYFGGPLQCLEAHPLHPQCQCLHRSLENQHWESAPGIPGPPGLVCRGRVRLQRTGIRLRGFSSELGGCMTRQISFGRFHSWKVCHLKEERKCCLKMPKNAS